STRSARPPAPLSFFHLSSVALVPLAPRFLHSPRWCPAKASLSSYPQLVDHLPRLVHRLAVLVHMVIHRPAEVPCLFLGSAFRTFRRRAGAQVGVGLGRAARRSL